MSGGAPAADSSNNLYVLTGNGIFDVTNTSGPTNDYGDSLLKLSSTLAVSQYLTPYAQSNYNTSDFDFGAGGAAILADLPATSPIQHLLICGGKDGNLYVVNRDSLGGYDSSDNFTRVYSGGEIFETAAFWNNRLYIASVHAPMTSFALDPATSTFSSSGTKSAHLYELPGSTPSVSAAGTVNGVVWGLDDTNYCTTTKAPGCGPSVLYAYDAANVATTLWNSAANTADKAGNAVKFTVPTVANGKVYVGTRGNNIGGADSSTSTPGELDIYALKP
jgi:hypothetical protein